ncbi:MAG TPA: MFS transporter [Candidatus Nanopelagicaceae bacterium]|nr:MFS transporter [Candidatus Nanopelagicaceae bacterium]
MSRYHAVRTARQARLRYYFAGRTLTAFGTTMANVALAFAVLDLSHNPADVGYVLAARSIPQAALLLLGGVVGDRFRRDVILVGFSAIAGLTQVLAAYLLLTFHATITTLIIIEAINGAAVAFTFPALQAVVPQLVEPDSYQSANAVAGTLRNTAMVLGPITASALIAVAAPGWLIGVNGLTFLVGALFFIGLRLPRIDAAAEPFLRQIVGGWSAFRTHTWIWVLVCVAGVENAIFAAGWITLGPVIANQTFGRSGWAIVAGAQSLGLLVSTLILVRIRLRRPLVSGMIGISLMAPSLLMLGLKPTVIPLVICALLSGIGLELFSIGWVTALQREVPPEALSRVFSYDALGSFVAIPLGQIVAVPLSSWIGLSTMLIWSGIIYLVLALLPLCLKSVRSLDATTPASLRIASEGANA